MWNRRLVWKNDSIDVTFQDQIVSLKESIQDDEVSFKATVKNGDQIKEVELRMTIKTSYEENNDPLKEEEEEYFEECSELKLINIQSREDNDLKYAHGVERTLGQHDRSSGDTTAKAATGTSPSQKQADIKILGNNSTATTFIQTHDHTEAPSIARRLAEGEAKLGNGGPTKRSNKDITVEKDLTSDAEDEDMMIEETFIDKNEPSDHEDYLNNSENLEAEQDDHTKGEQTAVEPNQRNDSAQDDHGGLPYNLRKRQKPVHGNQSASQPFLNSRFKKLRQRRYKNVKYNFDISTNKYLCRICNHAFSSDENVRQHIYTIHEGHTYDCVSCEKNYKQHSSRCKHRMSKHLVKGPKSL